MLLNFQFHKEKEQRSRKESRGLNNSLDIKSEEAKITQGYGTGRMMKSPYYREYWLKFYHLGVAGT